MDHLVCIASQEKQMEPSGAVNRKTCFLFFFASYICKRNIWRKHNPQKTLSNNASRHSGIFEPALVPSRGRIHAF